MALNDIAEDDIGVRTEPYQGYDEELAKSRILMSGTSGILRAGEKYLPKYKGELNEDYQIRKSSTFLYNAFKKTLTDLTARVFEKPVVVSDDAPQIFKDISANVDHTGRDLSEFSKEVFISSLQTGLEFLYIDSPPIGENETVAEATAQSRSAYIIHIKPENVIGYQSEKINNVSTITQFRFWENFNVKKNEFKIVQEKQIRVIDVNGEGSINNEVRSRIFRKDNKGKWVQHFDDSYSGLTAIPLVPFYSERHSYMAGSCPLSDLADVNLAHFRSQSDQINITHTIRVPILHAKGFAQGSDGTSSFSVGQIVVSTENDASISYVESTGKSVEIGQKELQEMKLQMQSLGLSLLVQRSGVSETATGRFIDDRKETSKLESIADSLKDALESCFLIIGDYQNTEFTGSIEVNKDISGLISEGILNMMLKAVSLGEITKKTFLETLVRNRVLTEDFDVDLELANLEEADTNDNNDDDDDLEDDDEDL